MTVVQQESQRDASNEVGGEGYRGIQCVRAIRGDASHRVFGVFLVEVGPGRMLEHHAREHNQGVLLGQRKSGHLCTTAFRRASGRPGVLVLAGTYARHERCGAAVAEGVFR